MQFPFFFRDLVYENEALKQRLLLLTRKLERAEVEYAQSKEYLESQLDISQEREYKINEQYRRYVALQVTETRYIKAARSLVVRTYHDITRDIEKL